ncbi:hypothetical protein Tco_1280583 [Tanacetum coccineum]
MASRSSPPSSPIHQILPAPPELPRILVVLFLPGQPIPIGRPYHTQPDGVLKMLTTRKSVGSLRALRLASRCPSDSSSSDSSSRYSSLGYAISDSPDDSSTPAFTRPSRKRCRSSTSSVPTVSRVREALSLVRADLSPPPKRIRDSDSVTDLEVSSKDGYEPYVPREADIDECIAYTDAIRAIWIDDRDVVETVATEEVGSRERERRLREDALDHVIADGAVEVTYETLGGLVQRFHDHAVEISVHQIQVIESEQRLQGHRITRVDLEVTTMTERIIESQRVDRLQRGLSRA